MSPSAHVRNTLWDLGVKISRENGLTRPIYPNYVMLNPHSRDVFGTIIMRDIHW